MSGATPTTKCASMDNGGGWGSRLRCGKVSKGKAKTNAVETMAKSTHLLLNSSRKSLSLSLKHPSDVIFDKTSGSISSTFGMIWVCASREIAFCFCVITNRRCVVVWQLRKRCVNTLR